LRTEALEPLTLAQQQNIDELHKWGMSADDIAKLITHGNVVAVEKYLNIEKELQQQLKETDSILMTSFEKRTRALETMAQATLKSYSFGAQIAALQQLIASEET